MTTKLTTFEEEKMRELEEHSRIRVILEIIGCQKHGADFERYVGLWTMLYNDDAHVIQDFIRDALHQQREMIRKELDEDLTLLLGEFANTPIPERKTGWDWIIRARLIVRSPLSNKKCECACHENKLKKPYEHDAVCCESMNGGLSNKEI